MDGLDYRPMVYICSPYRGEIQKNTDNARRYSRWAVDQGCIPIAPHLLFPQFMSEETEREDALYNGIVLLSKCDELWVMGSVISPGMREEMNKASKMKKKIRFIKDEEVALCN